MRLLLSAILICLPALPAIAATLQLEDGACDLLVKHVPSPDVQYQPGTDAYGRRVAPANLAPSQTLGHVEIPLTVDLANRLHLPGGTSTTGTGSGTATGTGNGTGPGGTTGQYGNEAYIGTVVVEGNNVLLDGHPLDDETEENLAVLCMHANPPQQKP